MDDVTTAVTLVSLDDPALAETWFTAICTTYDQVADADDVWTEFVDRLPAATDTAVGSGTALAWTEAVEDLTTDPAALLAALAARRDELASVYRGETEESDAAGDLEPPGDGAGYEAGYAAGDEAGYQATGEAGYEAGYGAGYGAADEAGYEGAAAAVGESSPAVADPFAWVHARPELVSRVETTLQYRPEHYESHLGPYLEQLWGAGWEQHPDEHKQAWLDQALAGLETSEATGPEATGPEATGPEATGPEATADTGAAEAHPAAEAAEAAGLAEVEQQVADALAEALAEVPEAAALSDEEIAEVLAEVLAEQAAASESV